MPVYGQRTAETIGRRQEADLSQFPELPWTFPGAEVVRTTFEIDVDACEEMLAANLARISPPIGHIVVARYPESPLGPFSEATLFINCRFRLEPKVFPVAQVVTSEAARRAYRAIWDLPAEVGRVELTRERNAAAGTEDITATIAAETPLTTIHLPNAYAVEPAMIRYDPSINVQVNAEGELEVFQFSGVPHVHEARLAKGASVVCNTDAWSNPWFRLRSLNMVAATFAIADLQLVAPVVQQPRPAGVMGGGLP